MASKRPRGPGHRAERIGESVLRQMSLMLQRELSDPRLAGATVTRVEVTSDLRLAKVHVAPSPGSGKEEEKALLVGLAHASGFIRRQLAGSLDLRYTPELRFYVDRSIQLGEHFLEVLEQVQAEERERKKGDRTP